MKVVYLPQQSIKVYLKNGTCIKADSLLSFGSRYRYLYGELPKSEIIQFESFNDLALSGILNYSSHKSIFSKKKYYNIAAFDKEFAEDEFDYAVYECKYIIQENPNMSWLKEDLGFRDYTQLVFDREQQLKKEHLQDESAISSLL